MKLATANLIPRPDLARILVSLDDAAADARIPLVNDPDPAVRQRRHHQIEDLFSVARLLTVLAAQGHLELTLEE